MEKKLKPGDFVQLKNEPFYLVGQIDYIHDKAAHLNVIFDKDIKRVYRNDGIRFIEVICYESRGASISTCIVSIDELELWDSSRWEKK